MIDLYVILGSVAVVAGMIALIVWLARSIGESDGERDHFREEIKRRTRMEALLARRRRLRGELVDWLRRKGRK
ncbi:MAG: hypothetical protein GY772_20660 [bacterium]|nr:hypothetical protein [Roseobacter sp.]MCP4242972.1 hypothetical protein [bacterium]HJO22043.1 hypothetical protein [Myxococcota bacterium]